MAQAKKRHWLSRLSFGTLSLVAAGLLVLAYLYVIFDPAKAWFFTLFGLLYPVVLPVTLVLWLWALIRRSSMRGLLTLVLLPSLSLRADTSASPSGKPNGMPPSRWFPITWVSSPTAPRERIVWHWPTP
ncbi:MAG: hypothetical protein J6P56_03605 [Bacteroidales bacterium]|nr:hypothetical protein [Bacteroidales bacterium]